MRKFKDERSIRQSQDQPKSDERMRSNVPGPAISDRQAIPLDDLTSPEVELSRIKGALTKLESEVATLRSGNAKLASYCENLQDQLRELKLVVSKTYVKEMRALERGPGILSRLLGK